MLRLQRTAQELVEASNHVRYEWNMFEYCLQTLASGVHQAGDQKLYNSVLTAFTIHTRNLLDFFYPSKNIKADDIVAGDYFDNVADWERLSPEVSETLRDSREQVNKLSAHLTYSRVNWVEQERWWMWVDIYNDLLKVYQAFIANVPASRVAQK
jgi:hypothetical protein